MALSGYVPGTTTFRARTDMVEGRAVQLVAGSLTDPVEVEYADNIAVIGISATSASAGELISVTPLNTDGTFEVDAVVETAISVGTDLYLADDGSGRVTDKDTTFFIGQSLSDSVLDNQRISLGAITGGVIAVGDAASVSIADAGGYYSSSNVEGALQEIGGVLSNRAVSESFPITNALILNPDTTPRDKANIGGAIASDSQYAVLVNDNSVIPGMIMARMNLGTGGDTSAYLSIALTPFYPLDNTQPMSIDLRYSLSAGTYDITGSLYILEADDSAAVYTLNLTPVPTTGGALSSLEIFSTSLVSGQPIQQMTLDMRVRNVTDPASLNLDILGWRLNYVTPALS